jgi:hypothetical protein
MHKNTAEGGVVTLDEHVNHTRWPCVPHRADVSCSDAVRAWHDPRDFRTLRPQEWRRDGNPKTTR